MKITRKQIAEGWTKNPETGVWEAPSEATKKALRERVLLVETHQEVGSDDRTEDHTERPTRKEIENSQLHAFQRVGLSRAEAIRAVELGNSKARFNKG